MLTEAIPGSLWQIKGIYATRKLVALITLEKIAFNKFSDQELAQINEAVEKVSEAWDFIKDTELAASGWHILMNRGVAYKVLGKIDKADWDLEEAFRLSNKFEAFRNLALHYLETGRAEKGLALMDSMNGKWSDETDEFEYKILYARFEVVQGKADVAIETLLPLLTDEQNEHNLRLLDLITLVYFQYGAYGKALPYALKMIERYSDVSNGYLAAGICYSRIGEIENALIHLGKAFDFAENSPQTALNIFQIAEEYYGLKQYEKAASCFEKILNGDNYNVTFKNLILSYFYGNELEKCITLCIRASTLSPGNPLVAEVLFRAYDELGEYKKAEDVLSQHFTSNDVNSFDHFRLLGIQLFKKTGQNEKSLKLSLEIVAPEKLTLAQRMSISSILLENGQIDAGLEMAYEARLDNYEVSDAHVSYLQTLAIRPKDQEEYIIPEVISIDAAFIIRDAEGKERTYFLTEDKRLSGSEILRPSDSFSPKVLDKRINDTIEMQNNYGVGNILTVVSIFNKYTYAFRDSQKLLETKYADESGMKFFNAGDGGIEAMKDFILKMSIKADQQKKELYDLYKNSAITIGMLAIHQTKSLVEVWFDMMAPDIGPILCYTHDESDRIAAVVNSNSYAVIDCFTLLTCFILMRRPELLENVNVKWAVTNSTLEELQTYVNELQRKGPTFSVGVEDGELRHGGITQGYIDELSKDINQIISWCNEKALVKTPKRIARAIDEVENVADMIGQSSYDTLLLASELNGAVVSEDDKFKMLAFKEYGRPTFSSYQLALYNAQTALITPDDFKKCYMSLLKHNYTYIPVNGIDLWELYDENGFKVQYSFVTGVKGLLIMMPERAALTISDFAKRVYLNLALNPTRASVLSYIFRTIRAHRDWQKIKAIITIISIKHFELMPSQRQEFLSIMNMN